MKKIWAIRKDAEAVSPVIATILMVAITVVLAAVLYVMVLGFGGTNQTTPALQIPAVTTITDGKKFAMTQPTADCAWTDLTLNLQQGTTTVNWEPVTADLSTGVLVTKDYGPRTVGASWISLNVTDLGGDGNIDNGDYFTLTGPGLAGAFTLLLVYEPTNGQMLEKAFTA